MMGWTAARRAPPTILLVDDDPALGTVLKEYLTEERFEVIHLHDSMAALVQDIDLLLAHIALREGRPMEFPLP